MKAYIGLVIFLMEITKKPEKGSLKRKERKKLDPWNIHTVMRKTWQLEFEVTGCIISTVRKQREINYCTQR